MTIEKFKFLVSLLPAGLARFSEWLKEFKWDRQIDRDLQTGRLDAVLKRADNHYEAGRCTSL